MGRRSNPLSTRVGRLISWPSNVSHPFLSSYLSHIFQECIIASPGIRSSTSGVWINLTLFPANQKTLSGEDKALYTHPKIKDPVLDFRGVGLSSVLGRLEERTRMMGQSLKFFQKEMKTHPNGPLGKTFLEAIEKQSHNSNHALHIYRDTPIHLKVNLITNPLLSADVMAQQIARASAKNIPLSRIFKNYLRSMN